MKPWLILLALLCLVATASRSSASADSGTTIAGGDLPHAVRLAATDADAFFRRLDQPPVLEDPPQTPLKTYSVSSSYWDVALRGDRTDRPTVAAAAFYSPETGFVRAHQGNADVWLVLDLRQRAILDRYIRLDRAGLLSDQPGVLDVLRAAAPSEAISVTVGDRELSSTEAAQFWQLAGSAQLRPGQPTAALPAGDASRATIVFGLAEGRSVTLTYSASANLLVDALASEAYAVPQHWLVPLLGPGADPGSGFDLGSADVPQQPGSGSPLWWPVMLGGGLACLGAAVWLRRLARPRV